MWCRRRMSAPKLDRKTHTLRVLSYHSLVRRNPSPSAVVVKLSGMFVSIQSSWLVGIAGRGSTLLRSRQRAILMPPAEVTLARHPGVDDARTFVDISWRTDLGEIPGIAAYFEIVFCCSSLAIDLSSPFPWLCEGSSVFFKSPVSLSV